MDVSISVQILEGMVDSSSVNVSDMHHYVVKCHNVYPAHANNTFTLKKIYVLYIQTGT